MLTLNIYPSHKAYNWTGQVDIDLEATIQKVPGTDKYGSLRIGFGTYNGGNILSQDSSLRISEKPGSSLLSFNSPGALVEAFHANTLYTDLCSGADFKQGDMGRGDVILQTTLEVSGTGTDSIMSSELFFPPNLPKTLYLQFDQGGGGIIDLETVGQVVVHS